MTDSYVCTSQAMLPACCENRPRPKHVHHEAVGSGRGIMHDFQVKQAPLQWAPQEHTAVCTWRSDHSSALA
jgi:hypothetical protein